MLWAEKLKFQPRFCRISQAADWLSECYQVLSGADSRNFFATLLRLKCSLGNKLGLGIDAGSYKKTTTIGVLKRHTGRQGPPRFVPNFPCEICFLCVRWVAKRKSSDDKKQDLGLKVSPSTSRLFKVVTLYRFFVLLWWNR